MKKSHLTEREEKYERGCARSLVRVRGSLGRLDALLLDASQFYVTVAKMHTAPPATDNEQIHN